MLVKISIALIGLIVLALTQPLHAQDAPQDYIAAHNAARADVRVGGMTWDAKVAAYAQNYANQRQGDCKLEHSRGPYGENIVAGGSTDFPGTGAVKLWVDEKAYYNYDANSCVGGNECRHYTQVVWRDSVRLGCAKVRCNSGGVFITCNYDPPGNFAGRRPY